MFAHEHSFIYVFMNDLCCFASTLHVGQIIIPHVSDVSWIWADNMLLSGYQDPGMFCSLVSWKWVTKGLRVYYT